MRSVASPFASSFLIPHRGHEVRLAEAPCAEGCYGALCVTTSATAITCSGASGAILTRTRLTCPPLNGSLSNSSQLTRAKPPKSAVAQLTSPGNQRRIRQRFPSCDVTRRSGAGACVTMSRSGWQNVCGFVRSMTMKAEVAAKPGAWTGVPASALLSISRVSLRRDAGRAGAPVPSAPPRRPA